MFKHLLICNSVLFLALTASSPAAPASATATVSSANAATVATAPANRALAALFDREFKLRLREQPEYATYAGVDTYNDRLSDMTPAAIMRRRAHVAQVIRELQGFDANKLNTQDRISRDLMLDSLRIHDAFNQLYGSLPFDGEGAFVFVAPNDGPQQEFAALVKATPFRNAADYERFLKRLAALPAYLQQVTDLMRIGMKSGWMPPREIMARVPGQFDEFVQPDVTQSPLFRPFAEFPAEVAEADRERITTAGRKLLVESVNPAFARMRSFVETEYIPACRASLAASDLPGGRAYYALTVRSETTTTLSPEAVHELGKKEVTRIQGEMAALIAQIGFQGSRAEFFDAIHKDPQFYYTRPEDMLRDYRDIAKRVDAELPKLFAELPRLPYGIRAMEAYEGDNAEHYTPGAFDGSRAGYFEANVLSLATRPKYDMENTFLHEAVPGHHLQIARAQELKGLPDFRRNGGYNAYVEGWALYAESLGTTVGLYRDPYSHFDALSWEMVRACRLVIDTGLHAFGWTREQAIRYMTDNTNLQEAFATAEVDRYIASPGQALGYKIGELKIKELRDRAKAALGDRFDIRTFHNAILDDGALPLTVLEARIDLWIAAQRKGSAAK